jgi:hypothetical protein
MNIYEHIAAVIGLIGLFAVCAAVTLIVVELFKESIEDWRS